MREDTSSLSPIPPTDVIGQSETFLDFMEKLSRVAKVDRPVLFMGERGTGKELAVSKLHYLSLKPFVPIHTPAIPEALLEGELFGYRKGAFTGATRHRKGRFESASGGTLFLDEIGNIPVEVQEKILRVVEYRTFEQVGSSKSIHTDVRIIGRPMVRLTPSSK